MATFDELRERLRAVDARQAAWRRDFLEAYRKLHRQSFSLWKRPTAAREDEVAARARAQAGEDVPRELFAFFDELCDSYRAEKLPQNRAKLRADVGGAQTLHHEIWFYAVQNADLVHGPGGEVRLARALAAVSLDDLRTDTHQVDELLARLWLAAVRAGLDPRAAFQAAAEVSNPGTGGGGGFMQGHLREFEGSPTFKTHVLPELRRLSA
jgi:hypothetical protein